MRMPSSSLSLLFIAGIYLVMFGTTLALPDDQSTSETRPMTDAARAQAASDAIAKVRSECHVSDKETDPKKVNKQADCVAKVMVAQRRKMYVDKALESTFNQVYGIRSPLVAGRPEVTPVPPSGNVGGSSSGTSTTCGEGSGANNSLIRVHRLLMAPKNASDDFGYRLGKRFIVYQVTISNDSRDFQFLIHDVSLDLSPLFLEPAGTYKFAASSQDLTLLRGIPEKGQDLDPRNLTLHVLQGIGSVAGGISGLTSFSDTMGSSVAVFNGPFLQSFTAIAPDHTGTQLNRLSDSAYITNTLIDKQRAKTIALFIPEATLLSRADRKQYWDDPYVFLQQINLNKADVCVDGAFITTLSSPTLTAAVLTPKVPATSLAPGGAATLAVQGTNLTAGDTQVFGLGTPISLSSATGTSGSVDLTLPPDYKDGAKVYVSSATNPSLTSVSVVTTTFLAPTLTSAVLKAKTSGQTLKAGVQVTLQVQGTNLTPGDTEVVGLGPEPIKLTSSTATSGSLDMALPPDYKDGVKVHLLSAANPSFTSAEVATTTAP
jgi:hypothetical protein